MKIFIDIGHPAHVHYFKNIIKSMEKKSCTFLVTARDKEVSHDLLKNFGIIFYDRGKGGSTLVSKFFYLFKANYLIYNLAKKFKPDIFISFSSPYAAQVSSILNVPHLGLTDTEHAFLGNLAFAPFSKKIITPFCFKNDYGEKHIRFNSYMELFYLHPKYFSPNPNIYKILKIKKNQKYTILRFVSWSATHDVGHKGISLKNKIKAINEFKKYGKVFISSESNLPSELEKYKINISPDQMHDVLASASLLYGESATMASESAVLGTPSIFIDNEGRGYTDEQENKYEMVFNFNESLLDQNKSITKGVEILMMNNGKKYFTDKSEKMVADKIDPVKFFTNYILNYFQKQYS